MKYNNAPNAAISLYYKLDGFNEWDELSMLAGFPGLSKLVVPYMSDMPSLYEGSGKLECDGSNPYSSLHSESSVTRMHGRITVPMTRSITKGTVFENLSNLSKLARKVYDKKDRYNVAITARFIKTILRNLFPRRNFSVNRLMRVACISVYFTFKKAKAIRYEIKYGTNAQPKLSLKPKFELDSKKSDPPTKTNTDNVISLSSFFNSQYSLISDLCFLIKKPQRSQYASTIINHYSA